MRTIPPVSPGEMLDEEFLKPLGLTKYRLAKDIGVPPQRIGDIVAGKRAIRPTPTCGCVGTSGSATGGGFGSRPTMTQRSLVNHGRSTLTHFPVPTTGCLSRLCRRCG